VLRTPQSQHRSGDGRGTGGDTGKSSDKVEAESGLFAHVQSFHSVATRGGIDKAGMWTPSTLDVA
jgi:hypothetical protein